MYYYSKSDLGNNDFIMSLGEHCEKNDLLLVDICIDDEEELVERYQKVTPAISIGPYLLTSPFSQLDLDVATHSARDRQKRLTETGNKKYQARVKGGVSINTLDKFSLYFSKYYAVLISAFLAIFVMIPFLAPILEKKGYDAPAHVIYKVYSVLCHQLAFRSFYLFGDQLYYPRELAQIDSVMTYEIATGKPISDLTYARSFVGDKQLGYKVALCERDIAIYGSLAVFGFAFQLFRKKLKQLPWYLWFVVALLPIAVDGFSQIPGLSSGWPAWVPIRESTPILRVLTGTLFGAGTGWYMFPLMEESMKETRIIVNRKLSIINKIKQSKVMAENEKN